MGRVSDARERLMEAVTELFWTGSYDSTTIDQICAKAGVKKGSFYYFFPDKAALAEAALEAGWQKYRPPLDALFSASVPPLDRIRRHCEFNLKEQADLKARHGCVLGCPLCTLGTEISTQEKGLQKKVQEIMAYGLRYLETAIRDAHAEGLIHAPNARAKANVIHAYQLGLLLQARIQNDLGVLRNLTATTFELLGAKLPRNQRTPVAA
jgi:TetR/AcrR family transcriptional regulator, transcriptional repressor for nem operon